MDEEEKYLANEYLVTDYFRSHFQRYARDEDILQSARIGLLMAIRKDCGRCPERFRAYAYKLMHDEIVDELRRRGKPLPLAAYDIEGVDKWDGVDSGMDADDVLSRLYGRDKSIAIMLSSGISQKEVSEHFKISQNRVRQIIKRIRRRLESDYDRKT